MINYNGILLTNDKSPVNLPNRGLHFGDGIFETIIYKNSEIQFFDLHWNRLNEGLKTLRIELPFEKDALKAHLLQLVKRNTQNNAQRIKLTIWRDGKGKYTPIENSASYLIENELFHPPENQIINQAFVSEKVRLHHHVYSHLKTISALTYVLAAIEKKERNIEELILLNQKNNIAEASSSNLFFYNVLTRKWTTPPLSSGCISGVSRRHLMSQLEATGEYIEEQHLSLAELDENYALFSSNVTGVKQIYQVNETQLNKDSEALTKLDQLFNEVP